MLLDNAVSILALVPLLPLVTSISIDIDRRAASSSSPVKNNGKRGLAYNNAAYTLPFSLSGQNSKVSWAYNWGQQETSSQFNPAIEYVPMLWSDNGDLTSSWSSNAQKAINNGATALLSFNEPDLCINGSACMSVTSSVTAYKKYMQPFAGKAMLGSPAVTNGGSPSGLTWLENFIGNCTGCQIDFITIHWYSNKWAGATYFKYQVEQARKIAGGRPIWITEFGLDNSDGTYSQAELHAFLQEILPWLDQQSDVHRYAYFMDTVGMLIDSDGKTLSDTGVIYNNYTDATAPVASTTLTTSTATTAASAVTKVASTSRAATTAKTSSSSKAGTASTSKGISTTSARTTSSTNSRAALASSSPSSRALSSSSTSKVTSATQKTASSISKATSSFTIKATSSSIAKVPSASTSKVAASASSKLASSSTSKFDSLNRESEFIFNCEDHLEYNAL
ncbi:hypothetical protein I317_07385 [Kwoniella heveanensis CBS 569]|nr:hypothetical protein I317_07385 [Kwoniella heveanensis CBS 569]